MLTRTLQFPVLEELQNSSVHLTGPRGVGKTSMAQQLLKTSGNGRILNWDERTERREIRQASWTREPAGLLVLDELPQYRRWRPLLAKAPPGSDERLLLLASITPGPPRPSTPPLPAMAHYRLHPLTCAELHADFDRALPQPGQPLEFDRDASQEHLENLLTFGGFPEPLLAQSEQGLRAWHEAHWEQLFQRDLRQRESIRDLAALELLAELHVDYVGEPLSLNAFVRNLGVSHTAVRHWTALLERYFFTFVVPPFIHPAIRGPHKAFKTYLWDYSLVTDERMRFSSLVAQHLLKFCQLLEDAFGFRVGLHYLRDNAGREVEFLVCHNNGPWFAVATELGPRPLSRSLRYFRRKLELPYCFQISMTGDDDLEQQGVRLLPARRFLRGLV